MLTWINENAKWVIAIFAVGIILGLLAMDRTPAQNHQYPIGRVDGEPIPYAEYDVRVKKIVENRYKDVHLEDEQYMKLRNDVFRSFVQQTLLKKRIEENGLVASVAEMKAELRNNSDAVRNMVGQEAQQRLYAIQSSATSQEDANARIQAYISTLPQFLVDSNFNKDAYDRWLNTPEAYEWIAMANYEKDLQTMSIPAKQLQAFVSANVHPTTLEAKWSVENRLTEHELEVAVVSGEDFQAPLESVDSLTVNAYFTAHPDSFFVEKDLVKLQYAILPVVATASDDAKVREYAMTLYFQLKDTTSVANFDEMARVASEDLTTAAAGGVLGDYSARGAWVKEFEDVAFALDSGAISEPVRTKFGYHIIQSHGKIVDSTGTEKVKVSHILLTVTASSETVDSLEQILTSIKTAVENENVKFEDVAKAKHVPVRSSEWIGRGDMIPELGFLNGLSAFAFVNKERPDLSDSKVSAVLKNKEFVLVATKTDSLVAGTRSVASFFEKIKNNLLVKKSAENAAHYLSSVADKVKSLPSAVRSDTTDTTAVADSVANTSIEKVKVETVTASFDGYVPGIGYASPKLYSVLKSQKVGEWGPVITTDRGAVMVKIISKTVPLEGAVNVAIQEELVNTWRFGYTTVFNEYISAMENVAKVENNIDLYFRD